MAGGNSSSACPLGLNNLGNTCYLNSVLQVLVQTHELFNDLEHNGPLTSKLLMLYERMSLLSDPLRDNVGREKRKKSKKRRGGSKSITPRDLFASCQELCVWINDADEMHDAHELLVFLLDTLHCEYLRLCGSSEDSADEEDVNGNQKNLEFYFGHHLALSRPEVSASSRGTGPFSEGDRVSHIFGLRLETSIGCERCSNLTTSASEYYVISLPIVEGTKSLDSNQTKLSHENEEQESDDLPNIEQCFSRLLEETYVEDFACDKCTKRSKRRDGAFLQDEIKRAPKVLAIHLKRFVHEVVHGEVLATKLETAVVVSPRLRLSCDESILLYQVYATVCHLGQDLDSGHYIAHVKAGDVWFYCSDDEIYPVSEQKALSAQAYMVFYRLRSHCE